MTKYYNYVKLGKSNYSLFNSFRHIEAIKCFYVSILLHDIIYKYYFCVSNIYENNFEQLFNDFDMILKDNYIIKLQFYNT